LFKQRSVLLMHRAGNLLLQQPADSSRDLLSKAR
jgi:hypothetical protein